MRTQVFKRMVLLSIAVLLCLPTAFAQVEFNFVQGEEWFPSKESWTYHYTYHIPQVEGEDDLSEELNHYFDGALAEMTKLVLPMYAADPIMKGNGSNEVSDEYEVTCSNEDFFSVLLHHRQSMEEEVIYSLSSVVFAVSGEYSGESLTLRGLAGEIGESSAQIAALIQKDVWRRIEQQVQNADTKVNEEMSIEFLAAEFFPETHFFADKQGDVVFYLQPGLLTRDDQPAFYTYTSAQLEDLITQSK